MYSIDLILEAIFGIIVTATSDANIHTVVWHIASNKFTYTDNALTTVTNGLMQYARDLLNLTPEIAPTRSGYERGVDKKAFEAACGVKWREQLASMFEITECENDAPPPATPEYEITDDINYDSDVTGKTPLLLNVPKMLRRLFVQVEHEGVKYWTPTPEQEESVDDPEHLDIMIALKKALSIDNNDKSFFDYTVRVATLSEAAKVEAANGSMTYKTIEDYRRGCVHRHHNNSLFNPSKLIQDCDQKSKAILTGLRTKFRNQVIPLEDFVKEAIALAAIQGVTVEEQVYTLLAHQSSQINGTKDGKSVVTYGRREARRDHPEMF
jgi:hypothetical protein